MDTTAGLLDWKLKVSVSAAFSTFRAVAVKTCDWPASRDTFSPAAQPVEDERHKLTLVGTASATTLVVLLWPQAARRKQLRMMQARNMRETNLPMNPSTKE